MPTLSTWLEAAGRPPSLGATGECQVPPWRGDSGTTVCQFLGPGKSQIDASPRLEGEPGQ